jgi:carbonic anhydrase
VPLVAVLGHEGCGAVTSALLPDWPARASPESGASAIHRAGAQDIAPSLSQAERVHAGVEANVRRTAPAEHIRVCASD